MEKEAQILVHREFIYPNRCVESYEWSGDIGAKICISSQSFDVSVLPWPMKFIETDWRRGDIYIRTDVNFWLITYTLNKIKRVFDSINARIILTAHVWGLVIVKECEVIEWKSAIKNKWGGNE